MHAGESENRRVTFLGGRTEKLFGIATATILSLLSAEKR
jgi:hypothetical protein